MNQFTQMMKKAQQMQAKIAEMQEKMANLEVDGASGAGLVKVTVNGKGEVKSLKIDPSVIDPNEGEVLEDLIVAALNDARQKMEQKNAEEMAKVTGDLKLPGGMGLPF